MHPLSDSPCARAASGTDARASGSSPRRRCSTGSSGRRPSRLRKLRWQPVRDSCCAMICAMPRASPECAWPSPAACRWPFHLSRRHLPRSRAWGAAMVGAEGITLDALTPVARWMTWQTEPQRRTSWVIGAWKHWKHRSALTALGTTQSVSSRIQREAKVALRHLRRWRHGPGSTCIAQRGLPAGYTKDLRQGCGCAAWSRAFGTFALPVPLLGQTALSRWPR